MAEPKDNRIENMKTTIQQLIDEKKIKLASYGGGASDTQSKFVALDDTGDSEPLYELLTQLKELDVGEERIKQLLKDDRFSTPNEGNQERKNESDDEQIETKDIIRELKNVKKQNTVTHWLVSALILVTLVWQMSEISIVLKVKDGLKHPFRSIGSALKGLIKRPLRRSRNGDDGENQNLVTPPIENMVEPPSLPSAFRSGEE